MWVTRHFVQDSEARSKLSVLSLLHPEGHSRAQSVLQHTCLVIYLPTNFVGLRHQPGPVRFPSSVSSSPESSTFLAPCQRIPHFFQASHYQSWTLRSSKRHIQALAPSCVFPIFSSNLSILLTSYYSARNRRNIFP